MQEYFFVFFIVIVMETIPSILNFIRKRKFMNRMNYNTIKKYEILIKEYSKLNGKPVKKADIYFFAFLISWPFIASLAFISRNSINFIIKLFVLMFATIMIYKNLKKRKSITRDTSVYFQLLEKGMNRNFHYQSQMGLSKADYQYANFEKFDIFYSKDYMEGKIRNIPYYMSRVLVERENQDSDGDKTYTTVFQGLVSYYTMPFDVGFFLYVLDNKIRFFEKGKISVENSFFQKNFDIYTDNEIKAYEFLTPDIMEEIVKLKKEIYCDMEFKLYYNKVYFRFHINDLFESSDNKTIAKELATYEFIILQMEKLMNLVYQISEEINKVEEV